MQWLKRIFGIKTPVERKQQQLAVIQEKAFQAQRNGDLRLAGKYFYEAEAIETEIVELLKGLQ